MACDDDNNYPLCKKITFVHCRSKFYQPSTISDRVTFKLVVQGNKLENGKNWFDSLFLLLPFFFLLI